MIVYFPFLDTKEDKSNETNSLNDNDNYSESNEIGILEFKYIYNLYLKL